MTTESDSERYKRICNETLCAIERDFKGRKVEDAIAEIRRFPGSLHTQSATGQSK